MEDIKLFTITEARSNLFKLCKLAIEGKNVVITKRDSNEKFMLIPLENIQKRDKKTVLKNIEKINLKTNSWDTVKEMLETRLDQ